MVASEQNPGNENDRQWCIVFLRAYGRKKPDGIRKLINGNRRPFVINAPDRVAALEKLSQQMDFGFLSNHYEEAPPVEEIQICKFDPQRRLVLEFKPTGSEPDGLHYCAAIWERYPETSNSLPTRDGAWTKRREMHGSLGDQYRKGLRNKWGDVSDLCPEIQQKIKIGRKGCWIWTGAHNDGGYGMLTELGKRYLAHRFIFEVLRDEIREGAILRHSCDVRCCCNPGHLLPGSPQENRHDQKGRRPFQETVYVDVPAREARKIRILYYAEKWTANRIAEEFDMAKEDVRLVVKYRTGTDEKRRAFENGYYQKP